MIEAYRLKGVSLNASEADKRRPDRMNLKTGDKKGCSV